MKAAVDEVEFRRVLAAPYPGGSRLRDALDIVVNGSSLSREVDGAPFDVDALLRGDAVERWSRTATAVPVLNCTCGLVDCGGYYVDVQADDDSVSWVGLGRSFTFDRAEFARALAEALRD